MKRKRSYDNRLRREQAEGTRTRILTAVTELVAAGAVQDLSIPRVAERAGVTVRTVYRYFPTRTDLIEAMQQWGLQQLGVPAWPRNLAELIAFPEPLFQSFDRGHTFVEAQLHGGALADVRARGKVQRVQALRRTLAEVLAPLPEEEQRAAVGIIKHLLSASAWQALRDDVGMTGPEAGRAVSWAISVLTADLAHRSRNQGGRHGGHQQRNGGAVADESDRTFASGRGRARPRTARGGALKR